MTSLKFVPILFILTLTISCQEKKVDCKQFKNGSFSMRSELTGTSFLVTRKDAFQTELEKETGRTTEWKVTWNNDCEYNLTLTKDNFGLLNSGKLLKAPSFDYEIIQTQGDYYIFKTTFDNAKSYITDTIWKTNL